MSKCNKLKNMIFKFAPNRFYSVLFRRYTIVYYSTLTEIAITACVMVLPALYCLHKQLRLMLRAKHLGFYVGFMVFEP